MNSKKNIICYTLYVCIGLLLVILSFAGKVDEFWNGMGSALIIIGGVRLLRTYRLQKNETYREKIEIGINDERNRFVRGKAWAWAGYFFILISGISVIIFKVVGQELLCLAASGALCLMLFLYWCAYWILQKKY